MVTSEEPRPHPLVWESIDVRTGHWDTAMSRAEAAFATLEAFEPGDELAVVAATLAGGYRFLGETQKAIEKAELALDIAEAHGSPETLTRAFAAKALVTDARGRPHEIIALRRHQLTLAREHDLPELESNALFNLSDVSFGHDRYEDALHYLSDALAITRRRGARRRRVGGTRRDDLSAVHARSLGRGPRVIRRDS